MAKVTVVNKARGRQRGANQVMVDALADEIEEIARREAAKRGAPVNGGSGLMAAMTYVLTNKDLMAEATRKATERLERDGVIKKDDPSIVRQPK